MALVTDGKHFGQYTYEHWHEQECGSELSHKYEHIEKFSEGLALVNTNNKYGFIDEIGDVIVPLKYDCAESFSGGLAAVKLNDKWGMINKKNEIIVPLEHDEKVSENEANKLR